MQPGCLLFRVWGLGFRVRVSGLGFSRVLGFWGLGFRELGFWFRSRGFGVLGFRDLGVAGLGV